LERVEKKGRIQSDLCFDDISIYELSCKGKKLIGSAQARRRDVCLQQGTVHLDEPDSNFPKSTGMITLKEILKKDIELKEFKDVVKRGFKDVFHIDYEELKIEDIKI
jgi:lipoate-protein ligase A